MTSEIRWTGKALFRGVVIGRAHLDGAALGQARVGRGSGAADDEAARLERARGMVREYLQEHVRSSHLGLGR